MTRLLGMKIRAGIWNLCCSFASTTVDQNEAVSVYAADAAGDGDVDVDQNKAAWCCMHDTIAWYENDGSRKLHRTRQSPLPN